MVSAGPLSASTAPPFNRAPVASNKTEQDSVRPQGEPGGEEKKSRHLALVSVSKQPKPREAQQVQHTTANLLPASTPSPSHVPNSLALIWLCYCQQALPGLLFGGNSSINYLTSPFCTTMEGFLFSPCILLLLCFTLSPHPSYSCVPNRSPCCENGSDWNRHAVEC